jgi:hypothetical protein
MVTAINDMAHALGIETVAEFIEDEEVLGLVRGIGVDFAQGYAVGRPQLLDESLVVDGAVALSPSPASRQARGVLSTWRFRGRERGPGGLGLTLGALRAGGEQHVRIECGPRLHRRRRWPCVGTARYLAEIHRTALS